MAYYFSCSQIQKKTVFFTILTFLQPSHSCYEPAGMCCGVDGAITTPPSCIQLKRCLRLADREQKLKYATSWSSALYLCWYVVFSFLLLDLQCIYPPTVCTMSTFVVDILLMPLYVPWESRVQMLSSCLRWKQHTFFTTLKCWPINDRA